MKVKDPGHLYELDFLDGSPSAHWGMVSDNTLTFVKRVGEKYPGNEEPAYPGTNLQEVLRACIDRVKYLDNQEHSEHNDYVLAYLRDAIWELEIRAATRHNRRLLVDRGRIETYPTCSKCGHIGCEGQCHP